MTQKNLLLLYALTRGLSHKLRTPLSVISNNLNYLAKATKDAACQQSLEKCQDISNILKGAGLDSAELSLQNCDLATLFLNVNSTLATPIPKLQLHCDLSKIKQALAIITQLVSGDSQPNLTAIRVEILQSTENLQINFTSSAQTFLSSPISQSFESLTDFFCLSLDRDSITAPLADAILWAHNYSIKVVQDVELRVEVSIPYESK